MAKSAFPEIAVGQGSYGKTEAFFVIRQTTKDGVKTTVIGADALAKQKSRADKAEATKAHAPGQSALSANGNPQNKNCQCRIF